MRRAVRAGRRVDLLERAPGDALDRGEVLGAVVLADAGAIVAEADVRAPVQGVFEAAVAVDRFARSLGADPPRVEAGEVVAALDHPDPAWASSRRLGLFGD